METVPATHVGQMKTWNPLVGGLKRAKCRRCRSQTPFACVSLIPTTFSGPPEPSCDIPDVSVRSDLGRAPSPLWGSFPSLTPPMSPSWSVFFFFFNVSSNLSCPSECYQDKMANGPGGGGTWGHCTTSTTRVYVRTGSENKRGDG